MSHDSIPESDSISYISLQKAVAQPPRLSRHSPDGIRHGHRRAHRVIYERVDVTFGQDVIDRLKAVSDRYDTNSAAIIREGTLMLLKRLEEIELETEQAVSKEFADRESKKEGRP